MHLPPIVMPCKKHKKPLKRYLSTLKTVSKDLQKLGYN